MQNYSEDEILYLFEHLDLLMFNFVKVRKYIGKILPVQKEEENDRFQLTSGKLLSPSISFIWTDIVPQISYPYK